MLHSSLEIPSKGPQQLCLQFWALHWKLIFPSLIFIVAIAESSSCGSVAFEREIMAYSAADDKMEKPHGSIL
jgi:hypothetical protein